MSTTNEKLCRLMKKYKLHRRDVAKIVYRTHWAVDRWLTPDPDHPNYRSMPEADLRLLEVELRIMNNEPVPVRKFKFEGAPNTAEIMEHAREARAKLSAKRKKAKAKK